MLARSLLTDLREYWTVYRPSEWLFEGSRRGKPLHVRVLQRRFRKACERSCLSKRATLHSLRHSFATHLIEAGTPLPYIQRLMGHRSIKSTMIYLRVQEKATQFESPLDRLIELIDLQTV